MIQQLTNSVYEIPLSNVNAHLIQTENRLMLIDTGLPGDERKINIALAQIDRSLGDLTQIIITHCHPDHAGSLAAVQTQTSAPTLMHKLDAEMVRKGRAKRPLFPAPGLLNKLLFRLFIASTAEHIEPARVDETVQDEDETLLANGLRVIHTPGHSAGHIALLWEPEGVLFAADTVMNRPALGLHIGYEDFDAGRRSAARLATYSFETAVFGHGKPLVGNASERFKKRFGLEVTGRTAVSA